MQSTDQEFGKSDKNQKIIPKMIPTFAWNSYSKIFNWKNAFKH